MFTADSSKNFSANFSLTGIHLKGGGGVCVSKCIKAVLFDNFPNIPIFCVKIPKSDPAPLKYHIVCNCFHRCVIHIFKFCSSKYASFLEGVPV